MIILFNRLAGTKTFLKKPLRFFLNYLSMDVTFEVTGKINRSKSICQKTVELTALGK